MNGPNVSIQTYKIILINQEEVNNSQKILGLKRMVLISLILLDSFALNKYKKWYLKIEV